MYVLWGIALVLLLAGGLVCWKVVVPFQHAKRVLDFYQNCRDVFNPTGLTTVSYSTIDGEPMTHEEVGDMVIEVVGGQQEVLRHMRLYVTMPRFLAPDRVNALVLLHYCGENTLPRLERLAADDDDPLQKDAAEALKKIKQARLEEAEKSQK
jgi:hypothetical protein